MGATDTPDALAIRSILERQRAASLANGSPSAEQRRDWIDRVIGLLVDHQDEIVDAVCEDFGHRSRDFSRITEVLSPLMALKFTREQLADWMKPELRRAAGGEAWVQYQPLGVVGIVTPWNFPVNLAFGGLAGALGAGNRVMLKPSELTPCTSELMARMIRSAFAEDEVAVVLGGPRTAQAFSAQPFDHLLFTGSTSVGRSVMRAAADNLVPVTLELGGKSPVILSRSADLKTAASKIMAGKLHNAGQICVAPDYVLVPEESLAEFVEHCRSSVATLYPTLLANPDYSSIINSRHYARLHGYLLQARAAGVETLELNPAAEDFARQPHNKLPPVLLLNPGDELAVMQDEIFGPILPLKSYRHIEEAVAFINRRPHPLSLYYFGNDAEEEAMVLNRTCAGGVTLNDVLRHVGAEGLPFGGVGSSGMGSYHGQDGFRTFSHAKAVLRAAEGPDLMRPPYSQQARQIVGSLIKR